MVSPFPILKGNTHSIPINLQLNNLLAIHLLHYKFIEPYTAISRRCRQRRILCRYILSPIPVYPAIDSALALARVPLSGGGRKHYLALARHYCRCNSIYRLSHYSTLPPPSTMSVLHCIHNHRRYSRLLHVSLHGHGQRPS